MGLKRYKRLIFGLSSASEIYQYVIQEVLQGIPGARNISDDIIVFGKTQEIHDQQLEITISRLAERGLTSGVASVDNWRGEYSYICVQRP